MKHTLAALAMGLALATAPIPKVKADATLSLGLSSSYHSLIALRGVLEGEHLGIQTNVGIGLTSLDFRYKDKLSDFVNIYSYFGTIGIYPLIHSFNQDPVFGLELGGGLEIGGKKGLSLGVEGGLIMPIPIDSYSRAFRVDLNLMYRIPLKK